MQRLDLSLPPFLVQILDPVTDDEHGGPDRDVRPGPPQPHRRRRLPAPARASSATTPDPDEPADRTPLPSATNCRRATSGCASRSHEFRAADGSASPSCASNDAPPCSRSATPTCSDHPTPECALSGPTSNRRAYTTRHAPVRRHAPCRPRRCRQRVNDLFLTIAGTVVRDHLVDANGLPDDPITTNSARSYRRPEHGLFGNRIVAIHPHLGNPRRRADRPAPRRAGVDGGRTPPTPGSTSAAQPARDTLRPAGAPPALRRAAQRWRCDPARQHHGLERARARPRAHVRRVHAAFEPPRTAARQRACPQLHRPPQRLLVRRRRDGRPARRSPMSSASPSGSVERSALYTALADGPHDDACSPIATSCRDRWYREGFYSDRNDRRAPPRRRRTVPARGDALRRRARADVDRARRDVCPQPPARRRSRRRSASAPATWSRSGCRTGSRARSPTRRR